MHWRLASVRNIQPYMTCLNPYAIYAETAPAAQIRSYLLRSGSQHTTLWGAAIIPFAARQPLPSLLIPFLDRHLQPHLQQMQHMLIDDPPRHTLHQRGMWNGVKVFRQIGINDIRVALVQQLLYFLDRI